MANKIFGAGAAANAGKEANLQTPDLSQGFQLPAQEAVQEQANEAVDWAPGGGEIEYIEQAAPVSEQNTVSQPTAAEPRSAQAVVGLSSLNAGLAQAAKPAAQPVQNVQEFVQNSVQVPTSLTPKVQEGEAGATIPVGASSVETFGAGRNEGPSAPVETSGYAQGQSEKPEGPPDFSFMDNTGKRPDVDRDRADSLRSKSNEMARREYKAPEPVDFSPVPRELKFKQFQERDEEEAKQEVTQQAFIPTGNTVATKLVASANNSVGMREVSIGSNYLWDAINQEGNKILNRINSIMGTDFQLDLMNEDSLVDLVDVINEGKIFVTLSKPPQVDVQSYQKRILKVHYGDGIMIHPLAAKAFTADFDGDGGNLHLDGERLEEARDAMAYLIGIDGTPQLDFDYLPIHDFGDIRRTRKAFASHFSHSLSDTDAAASLYQKAIADDDIVYFLRETYALAGSDANMAQFMDEFYTMQNAIDRAKVDVRPASPYLAPQVMLEAKKLTASEAYVAGLYEEAKKGRIPANFNQYVNDMAHFVGDISSANPDFRESGSAAREAKRTNEMIIGDYDYSQDFEYTAQHIMSLAMASRAFSGTKSLHLHEELRNHIVKEVGMPTDQDLEKWFPRFGKAYNKWKMVEIEAKTSMKNDLTFIAASDAKLISFDPNAEYHTYDPFVEPFLEIYGDWTVGYLMGDNINFAPIPEGQNYDMWSDSHNTKWVAYKHKHVPMREFAYTNKAKYNSNPRQKRIRTMASGQQWTDLLAAIADSKTGAAAAYEHNSIGPAIEAIKELVEMITNPMYRDNHKDYMGYIESKYMATLASMHPDMFSYYGMDNARGFAESRYGKLFLKKDEDYRSVYMSMLIEWRLSRVNDVYDYMQQDLTSDELAAAQQRLSDEFEVLASSSDVWRAIGRVCISSKYSEIWNKIESAPILSYLTDPSVPASDKEEKLAELVHKAGIWEHTQPYEVLFQLSQKPASNYAGLNHLGWEENKADPVKASLAQFGAMKPDWEQEQKIYRARNLARKNGPRAASKEDQTKAADIQKRYVYNKYAGDIADDMVIDALVASLEKSTSDAEKAQTQGAQAAYYKALADQRNGGVINTVYLTNDQVIGVRSIRDLNKHDIIDVLRGNDVTYYDEDGELHIIRGSDNAVSDLLNNRSLMAALERQEAAILPGADADIEWRKKNPFTSTVISSPEIQKLYDHTGYNALIALFTPQNNMSDLTWRQKARGVKRDLDNMLTNTGFNPNDPIFDRLNQMAPGADVKPGDLARELLTKYCNEVGLQKVSEDKPPMNFEFDSASVGDFWAARQQLNAAKTSTSTGAEGAMSSNHELLEFWLAILSDEYIEVTEGTDMETKEQLVGQPTVLGVPFEIGMNTIVYAPNLDIDYDPTLTEGPKMNSVSRRFMIVRQKSGEDFNTKLQKYGDDGTDSITKNSRIEWAGKNWWNFRSSMENEWNDLLQKGTDPDAAIEVIRFRMANILKQNDLNYGYKYLSLAELMNTAKLMVIHDNGTLIFRSLPQISQAINSKLPSRAPNLYNLERDDEETVINIIYQEMTDIVNNVGKTGITTENGTTVLNRVKKPAKNENGAAYDSLARQRSSSSERNYKLLSEVIDNGFYQIKSNTQKKKINDKLIKKSDLGNAFSDMYMLGLVTDKFSTLCLGDAEPGPQNFVYCQSVDADRVSKCAKYCKDNLMSLVLPYAAMTDDMWEEYGGSAVIWNARIMIPFFDMELNGYGETQSGSFHADPSNVVWHMEDGHNRYSYADASCIPTDNFINNRISSGTPGRFEDKVSAMFMNTLQAYGSWRHQFRLASPRELELIRTDPDIQIDMRIKEQNANYDWYKNKYDKLLARFFDKWDGESQFLNHAGQDEIIGFMCCQLQNPVTGDISRVYAPIIPYIEGGAAKRYGPDSMTIGSIYYDPSLGTINVDHTVNTDMHGRYAKVHEGLNRMNKMVMFGKSVQDHELRNGKKLDLLNAKATSSNRRLGTNKRMQTISTAMFMTYCDPENAYRFNFADSPGALPGSADLRNVMRERRLTEAEWESIDWGQGIKWHGDPRINSFVKHQISTCRKRNINPSDYLSNLYTVQQPLLTGDINPVKAFYDMFFEFDMTMNTSMSWQNEWMHFMHHMQPTLVGDGFDGDDSECLFKTCRDDGYDYGCLQMEVPYYDDEGNIRGYTLENVYAGFSFFGEDNSAFKRAGLNGAQIEYQTLLQSVHGGNATTHDKLEYLRHALSGHAPQKVKYTSTNVVEVDNLNYEEKSITSNKVDWDPNDAVSFTGHRPNEFFGKDGYNKDNWRDIYRKLYTAVENAYSRGKTVFINGGAQGIDQIAALAVDELRKKHPEVRSIMAIPYESQSTPWRRHGDDGFFGHNMWMGLRENAENYVLYEDPSNDRDAAKKLNDRNKWMLDHSSELIEGWTGKTTGGTYNTHTEATNRGYRIVNILDAGMTNVAEVDVIDKFRDSNYFLSNMFPVPVEYNGLTFTCSEAAFQAQKDPSRAKEFVGLDGYQAKKLGKQIKINVSDWNKRKDKVMADVVMAKFQQNPQLKQKLLDTKSTELIEGNTHGDKYWGVSNGIGENKLGGILMDTRKALSNQ